MVTSRGNAWNSIYSGLMMLAERLEELGIGEDSKEQL
jgi:hypothetical protein